MSAAMKSMNLEKISTLMDNFEKEFEDLDVQTSVMEGAMSQTTATNIPQDAVEGLMKQAADEAGLELNMELPGAQSATIGQSTQVRLGGEERATANSIFVKGLSNELRIIIQPLVCLKSVFPCTLPRPQQSRMSCPRGSPG